MEHALRMSMQDTHEVDDGSKEERSNAPRVSAEEAQRGYMRAIGAEADVETPCMAAVGPAAGTTMGPGSGSGSGQLPSLHWDVGPATGTATGSGSGSGSGASPPRHVDTNGRGGPCDYPHPRIGTVVTPVGTNEAPDDPQLTWTRSQWEWTQEEFETWLAERGPSPPSPPYGESSSPSCASCFLGYGRSSSPEHNSGPPSPGYNLPAHHDQSGQAIWDAPNDLRAWGRVESRRWLTMVTQWQHMTIPTRHKAIKLKSRRHLSAKLGTERRMQK